MKTVKEVTKAVQKTANTEPPGNKQDQCRTNQIRPGRVSPRN